MEEDRKNKSKEDEAAKKSLISWMVRKEEQRVRGNPHNKEYIDIKKKKQETRNTTGMVEEKRKIFEEENKEQKNFVLKEETNVRKMIKLFEETSKISVENPAKKKKRDLEGTWKKNLETELRLKGRDRQEEDGSSGFEINSRKISKKIHGITNSFKGGTLFEKGDPKGTTRDPI